MILYARAMNHTPNLVIKNSFFIFLINYTRDNRHELFLRLLIKRIFFLTKNVCGKKYSVRGSIMYEKGMKKSYNIGHRDGYIKIIILPTLI